MRKPKLALYWAASCGGCDMAVLELKEKILDVADAFDLVFWPVALDYKYKDVEAMDDGEIDVCLFNGAIRNSENEHVARLLRRKSKVMVAFGACAMNGGIPGLANVSNRAELIDLVYRRNPSVDNLAGTVPQTRVEVPEGELTLPELYDTVRTLDQTVVVDYYVPGCPPEAAQVWDVVTAVIAALKSGVLPPHGAVLGVGEKSVCDECARLKEEKKVSGFKRPWEIIPDPEKCLLEQGIICMGPATRAGCGARCPSVGMPCRGCYGAPAGVLDQGAKMLSALASIIDADTPEEIARIAATVPDPLGTFYRFGLAGSLLRRTRMSGSEEDTAPVSEKSEARA
jgi:F420-non-reducing hydrogenase small subunit